MEFLHAQEKKSDRVSYFLVIVWSGFVLLIPPWLSTSKFNKIFWIKISTNLFILDLQQQLNIYSININFYYITALFNIICQLKKCIPKF